MKLIPLSNKRNLKYKGQYFAKVDDKNYEELIMFDWSVSINKKKSKFYAVRKDYSDGGKVKTIKMHRQILGILETNLEGEHINSDGIDNQEHNLRVSTHQQNTWNSLSRKNTESKYKGLYRLGYKTKKCPYFRWVARIGYNGKLIWIGAFKEEIDAAKAYDAKAKELFGEYAKLNFPNHNV